MLLYIFNEDCTYIALPAAFASRHTVFLHGFHSFQAVASAFTPLTVILPSCGHILPATISNALCLHIFDCLRGVGSMGGLIRPPQLSPSAELSC